MYFMIVLKPVNGLGIEELNKKTEAIANRLGIEEFKTVGDLKKCSQLAVEGKGWKEDMENELLKSPFNQDFIIVSSVDY